MSGNTITTQFTPRYNHGLHWRAGIPDYGIGPFVNSLGIFLGLWTIILKKNQMEQAGKKEKKGMPDNVISEEPRL